MSYLVTQLVNNMDLRDASASKKVWSQIHWSRFMPCFEKNKRHKNKSAESGTLEKSRLYRKRVDGNLRRPNQWAGWCRLYFCLHFHSISSCIHCIQPPMSENNDSLYLVSVTGQIKKKTKKNLKVKLQSGHWPAGCVWIFQNFDKILSFEFNIFALASKLISRGRKQRRPTLEKLSLCGVGCGALSSCCHRSCKTCAWKNNSSSTLLFRKMRLGER